MTCIEQNTQFSLNFNLRKSTIQTPYILIFVASRLGTPDVVKGDDLISGLVTKPEVAPCDVILDDGGGDTWRGRAAAIFF